MSVRQRMQIPNSARLFLSISVLLSGIGVCVGGYQSIEVWQTAFSGGRFYNVGQGMSVLDWTLIVVVWLLPVSLVTFATRRWTLKLHGFPLVALVLSVGWVLFLASTVAVLYSRSETGAGESSLVEDVVVH